VIATGYQDSDWYHFGEHLKPYLEEKNIELEELVTSGAVDNFQLLVDPNTKVNAAYTYGGALTENQAKQVYSLGSITYEPIWIFYNSKKVGKITRFKDISNLEVGVGPKKSGSFPLTQTLFKLNGIDIEKDQHFHSDQFETNLDKFNNGTLDVYILVSSINEPIVKKLLNTPNVELFNFTNAEAYQKKVPYFDAVKMPAGSVDIAKNIPSQHINLVATTMSLVVKKTMHPDLQLALLMSQKQVLERTEALFFGNRNEFPAYVDTRIPISPVAQKYITFGPPQLLHYLPFWTGLFLTRFWLVILTIGAALYPLSKLHLGSRKFQYEVHKYPGYRDLLEIDKAITLDNLSETKKLQYLKKLEELNTHVCGYEVPIGMEKEYFRYVKSLADTRLKILRLPKQNPPS